MRNDTTHHFLGLRENFNRSIFLSFLTALSTLSSVEVRAEAVAGNPRLVVSVLVDGLRSDYLESFMPLYGENGFKRLWKEGKIYTQGYYSLTEMDRAIAAATFSTGTYPSQHGVIGAQWFDRTLLRQISSLVSLKDQKQSAFSSENLMVSTIADELKRASKGQSLVYSIAPYADAAIFSIGHNADAALWIDEKTRLWTSSAYYEGLPQWATELNEKNSAEKRSEQLVWKPYNAQVSSYDYFHNIPIKTPFSHRFVGKEGIQSFIHSGLVNQEVISAALQCLKATALGIDEKTDYLALTLFAGNYKNYAISTAPLELQDTYVRLDREIAHLLRSLEHKIGLRDCLFVLTSTGREEEEEEDLAKYRIPSGVLDIKRSASLLNMYLAAIYGQGQYIIGTLGTQLYLNYQLLESKQLKITEVLRHTQEFLLTLNGINEVYTSENFSFRKGDVNILNGYYQKRSGDIRIVPSVGWRLVNADNHTKLYARASYLPFPIIFLGRDLPTEKIDLPTPVVRVAATISKALRIRGPNACKEIPLF